MPDASAVAIPWVTIIATLATAVGIPFLTDWLKGKWPTAPAWLKTIAPVLLVPLITGGAALLSSTFGIDLDFSAIIAILMGGALGSTAGFKLGDKHGVKKAQSDGHVRKQRK